MKKTVLNWKKYEKSFKASQRAALEKCSRYGGLRLVGPVRISK